MSNRVSGVISDDQLNRIIQIESAGKPLAAATTSTATGFGQFLNQTWLGVLKEHGPREIAERITRRSGGWTVQDGGLRAILDLRKGTTKARQKFNIDMLARFTEDNAYQLGPGWNDGDLYLAHFLGTNAARKVLRASPNTSVEPIVGDAAVRANKSILAGKTCGQVRTWALNSMLNRWIKAGKPDWIGKFWYQGRVTAEQLLGVDGLDDEDERPPVKTPVTLIDQAIPHNEHGQQIRDVQKLLKTLGYHEVGALDGKWGGRTAGSIKAFMNDRGMVGEALITDELTTELAQAIKDGWSRPIAPARADASDKVVEEKVPAAKESSWSRFWAKLGLGGTLGVGTASGALDFVSDHSDTAADWWNKVSSLSEKLGIDDVPFWAWLMIGGLLFALIWRSQRFVDKSLKDAYRSGEIN